MAGRSSTRSQDEHFTIIACGNPNDERQFIVPRHVLCISPVFRGYIEDPGTIPPWLGRNGAGTFTLNTNGAVVNAMLVQLRQGPGDVKSQLQTSDRDPVFLVRLYKLALSLALDDLRATTLLTLRTRIRRTDDFIGVALEASNCDLVTNSEFHDWFSSYVKTKHDDLLETLGGDSDPLKLCRVFMSALAHARPDIDQNDQFTGSNLPPTPDSSLPRKKQASSATPSKSNKTTGSSAKKRKYNASVEDAPESD